MRSVLILTTWLARQKKTSLTKTVTSQKGLSGFKNYTASDIILQILPKLKFFKWWWWWVEREREGVSIQARETIMYSWAQKMRAWTVDKRHTRVNFSSVKKQFRREWTSWKNITPQGWDSDNGTVRLIPSLTGLYWSKRQESYCWKSKARKAAGITNSSFAC